MRLRIVAVLILLACVGSASAAPGGCTNDGWLNPMAFESITVSTTSIGLTQATFAPPGLPAAVLAVITSETADIRYRSDGIAPTAAVGQALAFPGTLTVCGFGSLQGIRFIRQTADATLRVAYYKQVN